MNRSLIRSVLTAAVALVPVTTLAGSVYLNGVKIDGVTNQKFEKASVRIDEQGNIFIEAVGYAARVTTTPAPTASAPATPATPASATATAPTQGVAAPATGAVPAAGVAAAPATGVVPASGAPAPASAAATPATAVAPATPPPTPGRISQRYWLVTEQTVPGMAEYDIDVYVNSRWLRKLRGNEDQVVWDITRQLLPGANTVTLIARKVALGTRRSYSPEHAFRVIIGEGNEGGGNVMIDNPIIRFQKTAADSGDDTREFTLTTR